MTVKLSTLHPFRTLANRLIGVKRHLASFAVALFSVMVTATITHAYEISDNGDTIILMNATHDEYIQLTTAMMPEYRVRNFSVRGSMWDSGERTYVGPFYSCILEKNVDDINVYHQIGLTALQLQAVASNLGGDMEMMQILAYRSHTDNDSGYVERYGYLAYDREGPDWTVYVDVPNEWVDDFEAMLPSDQNVVNRCYTNVWPSYMTALYKADNTETIDMRASMTENEFIIMRDHLAGEGFRVTSMRTSESVFTSSSLFMPIFKRDGNLRYTTEAFAKSDSDGIEELHKGQVSHMQPTWIASRDVWSRQFIVGFHGQAVWNEQLQPSAENGFFDPHLAAPPKPHDNASKADSSKSIGAKKTSK